MNPLHILNSVKNQLVSFIRRLKSYVSWHRPDRTEEELSISIRRLEYWLECLNSFKDKFKEQEKSFMRRALQLFSGPKEQKKSFVKRVLELFHVAHFLTLEKKRHNRIEDEAFRPREGIIYRLSSASVLVPPESYRDKIKKESDLKVEISRLEDSFWADLRMPMPASLILKGIVMSDYYKIPYDYVNYFYQILVNSKISALSPSFFQQAFIMINSIALGISDYLVFGNAALAYTAMKAVKDLFSVEQHRYYNFISEWILGLVPYLFVLGNYSNLSNLSYSVISYFMMTNISQLIETGFDKLSKCWTRKNDSFLFPLAQSAIQHISTVLLTSWLAPLTYDHASNFFKKLADPLGFIDADSRKMLTMDCCNPKLVIRERCETVCRTVFGFRNDTKLTVPQIKKEWHRLSLLHHPDKEGGSHDTATLLNLAAENLIRIIRGCPGPES